MDYTPQPKDICALFLSVLLPPLGVFLERGCGSDLLINIVLTILGYIPGVFHAVYIILKYSKNPLLVNNRQNLPFSNQNMTSTAPGTTTGVNPNVNPGVNPNVNPGVNPNVNPGVNPNINPDVNRGVIGVHSGPTAKNI